MSRALPLVGLLTTLGVATVGLRVAGIAIPWFVLTTSGSATQTGLVVAAEFTPYVLTKALGGPLVDRLGQRRVSITTDLLSAGLFALVPLLHHLGALPLPALLATVALAGALRGPGDSAKHTLAPLVASATARPLTRVTGLVGATDRSAGLVGPGLAAVLITALGPPATVLVTAGCFALSALVLGATVPTTIGGTHREDRPEPYLRQLRQGWRLLVGDRLLFGLAVMIAVTNLLDTAKASVLLPVWAERQGHGIAAVGLLLTCLAGAQIVTSVLASWLGERLPRRRTYFIAFAIAGPPPFLVLGLDAGLALAAVTYVVAGLASGLLNPMLGAIIYERIPERMLGRVTAPLEALAWAGIPLGGLVAAGLVAAFGLGPALLVSAGAYLTAVLVPAITSRSSFDPPARDPAGSSVAPIPAPGAAEPAASCRHRDRP